MDKGYAAWAARWRVPLGFALGLACLILSQPTFQLIVAGALTALPGLLVRALAAGYLTKNQSLTTTGPYAHTRNPLYLGSLLMGLGLALASGSWLIGGAFLVYFLAVYGPVTRREAEGLQRAFGEAYAQYAREVPLFLPRWSPRRGTGGEAFQWQRYRKNREYQAALGYLAVLGFFALKAWLR